MFVIWIWLIMIRFFGFILGTMAKNQDKLRHSWVAQHASVQSKWVRPSRPPVGATSFDLKSVDFLSSRASVIVF